MSFPFFEVRRAVFANATLDKHSKLVLLVLVDHIHTKTATATRGMSWPTWERIASWASMSRSGVHQSLRDLEAAALIQRLPSGRHTYEILSDAILAGATIPEEPTGTAGELVGEVGVRSTDGGVRSTDGGVRSTDPEGPQHGPVRGTDPSAARTLRVRSTDGGVRSTDPEGPQHGPKGEEERDEARRGSKETIPDARGAGYSVSAQERNSDRPGPGTPRPPDRTIDPSDVMPPIPEASPEPAQDPKPGSRPETSAQDPGSARVTLPKDPRVPVPDMSTLAMSAAHGPPASSPASQPSEAQAGVSGAAATTDPSGDDGAREGATTADADKAPAIVRYLAAFEQGANRVLGAGGWLPPTHKAEHQALGQIIAHRAEGRRGSELLTWIADLAERYVSAKAASPYERGFIPSKCKEWLTAERARDAAKRSGHTGVEAANPDGDGMECTPPGRYAAERQGPLVSPEEVRAQLAAVGLILPETFKHTPPKTRAQVEAEQRACRERPVIMTGDPEAQGRAALAELTASMRRDAPKPAKPKEQIRAELRALAVQYAAEDAAKMVGGETRH